MRTSVHLLALGLAALAGPAWAQDGGTGTGTSDSNAGRQRTDYGFPADATMAVDTPRHAFVWLPAGLQPLRASDNGIVLLRDDQSYFRWSAGSLLRLHDYMAGGFHVEGPRMVSARTSEDMNAVGTIAINIQSMATDMSDPGAMDEDDRVTTWTADASQPVTYLPEAFAPVESDGRVHFKMAVANLHGVDNADTVWVTTNVDVDNAQPDPYFVTGLARVTLSGTMTPFFPSDQANNCLGVSRTGIPLVRIRESGYDRYFVGTTEVGFVPESINDHGIVLGHDPSNGERFIWSPDGHTDPLPSDGTVTFVDGEDRLHGIAETGGSPVVWIRKTDDEGRPLTPVEYERVDYVPLAMPAGWTTNVLVPPGPKRVTTGLATRAIAGESEIRPFLAVPATLRVDFNRDGVIDTSDGPGNPDDELVEKALPYFFWVNDDDDTGETGGDDIPGQPANRADGTNAAVDGTRDLVDFFPVYLDIRRLLEVLPPASGVTYKLSHATGALNCLITDLTPAVAGRYLTDVPTATSLGAAEVIRIPSEGVALPADFLEEIRAGDKGVVLIEANAPTTAPLALEVWKGADRLATLELPLSIGPVEQMFRHVNLCGAAGVLPETRSRSGTPNWDDRLSSAKVLLFVHGYNVNQQEARGAHAEMFKRLWWSGSRARFWGVTWFGYESQTRIGGIEVCPDYHSNVVNAFATGVQLASFIAALQADGATDISVAAHSLGAMVVSSAISDHGCRVKNVFLIDGAVAAEAFDAAEAQFPDGNATMPHTEWTRDRGGVYPSRLWTSQWCDCFPAADARHALTWRDRFADRGNTAFFNFYSTGDEVLDEDAANTPNVASIVWSQIALAWRHLFGSIEPFGRYAWAYQEKFKGRMDTDHFLGSTFGGWGFNTFDFRKAPGTSAGSGPSLSPDTMTPQQAAGATVFTTEVLQQTPFFAPGDDYHEIGSWQPTNDGEGIYRLLKEPLGLLYGASTADFATRHRNTLLARMIPATSLAAGRKSLGAFGDPIEEYNFDMNFMMTGWPVERQTSDLTRGRWQHGDYREVAFLYTHDVIKRINVLGGFSE